MCDYKPVCGLGVWETELDSREETRIFKLLLLKVQGMEEWLSWPILVPAERRSGAGTKHSGTDKESQSLVNCGPK